MCPVCEQRSAQIGVLCTECRDELSIPIRATPEQVQRAGAAPGEAALVDIWGRPHPIADGAVVGRATDGGGLAVLEPSVSRRHARLARDGGAWRVHDLGSANGTYVDDAPVEGSAALPEAARVRFGQIAFYFLHRGAALPVPRATEMATALIPRAIDAAAVAGTGTGTGTDAAAAAREPDDERTDPGLPTIELRLHEPTGGGGGLVELDGKRVQLTATQLELLALMIQRMTAEVGQPSLVRGFVRSSELIAALSWDTRDPSENHVKQLVRRVRRALLKISQSDLIESRHRFGYRLRAIPTDPATGVAAVPPRR